MKRRLGTLLGTLALLSSMLVDAGGVYAANQAANLDQCGNDPAPSLTTDGCSGAPADTGWVNGNLGASKSVYHEGDSIPYRMTLTNLAGGTSFVHTITIQWDTAKAGKHALDYLTKWNRTVANANPCLGVSGCSLSTFNDRTIPADPQITGF